MASNSICFTSPTTGSITQSLTSRRSIVNQTQQLSFKNLNTTTIRILPLKPLAISATIKRNPKRLKYSAPRFTKDDGFVYVEVDPSGSDTWKLEPVIKLLQEGAVGVIPTDTVYAFVCDVRSPAAIEHLRRVKDIGASKIPTHWDVQGVPDKVIPTSFE